MKPKNFFEELSSQIEESYEGKIISWEEHRPVVDTIKDTTGKVIELIPSDTTTITIKVKKS